MQALQDMIPENHCWGCGTENPNGLQIKSYFDGRDSRCTFQPQAQHMAGPTHILNGGIIATLIDCHCVCTAIAAACQAEGRALDSRPLTWFATASLHVDYLRPVPIDHPVHLLAYIAEQQEKKIKVACSLYSGENECARGEVLALRVPPSWREKKW